MNTATATPQILTHSRLSCFRECPRKHYLRYELGLRPELEAFALRVGTGFHAALDAADKGLDVSATLETAIADPFDLALVAAMVNGHVERWKADPVEVIASELVFDIPCVNPETGKPTPLFRLAGVVDRIVRLPDGRVALMEYKTTSRDFSPGADYWTALHRDQQLSIYVLAARALGHDVSTVLYDVTRRPAQRPFKATPVEERRYTEKASKLKDGTVRPAGSLHANQRETDETPTEFAARVAEPIAADPHRHFARIEIARLDRDLLACQEGVWQQMQTIRAMQRSGPQAFYANPSACITSYGSCPFMGVCDHDDLAEAAPEGFFHSSDLHPELMRGDATDAG